jgi:hypothetical protein
LFGVTIGCTLPQSAPLNTPEDSIVHSMGLVFCRIVMVPVK